MGVSACNTQGCGAIQATTPPYEHARKRPAGPTSVVLAVTSATKLTVAWGVPSDNGGDAVTSYYVKWNTNADMTFPGLAPDKGSVQVFATNSFSYTINDLTPGQTYYATVSACNLEGCGIDTASNPTLAVAALQRPGKAVYVSLSNTDAALSAGQLLVTMNFPLVPDHGIPCSGRGTALGFTGVSPCPAGMGYGTMADGGTPVTRFDVILSSDSTFSTGNLGPYSLNVFNTQLVSNVPQTLVITNLPSATTYFVRVVVYNAVGPSQSCDYDGQLCSGARLSINPKATYP